MFLTASKLVHQQSSSFMVLWLEEAGILLFSSEAFSSSLR